MFNPFVCLRLPQPHLDLVYHQKILRQVCHYEELSLNDPHNLLPSFYTQEFA
jgi:hypothetical protein